ncbi:hypothetical protein BJY21_002315 [Kineosphaera limosa]|uniref:Transporter suffix domain-containing protein n=1 Tax=Kineosphaera limosa NBRC 100340 TaxID=1184609 RepID=K6WG80_9MICO|nr:transporter suffix domain-containing protein [Kineosphaera limosa]NYE01131.1 hypothetical protein [Kineosphaera limosa]GAB98280.1 hypothetical protein KILIM_121_00070 [Kineosphaera limosa NBRC 100340]
MATDVTTRSEGHATPNTTHKPLRFRVGMGLLIVYPFMFLVLPIAPFLPMDAAGKGILIGGAIGLAEVILLVAIACVGKETYQTFKARITARWPKRKTSTD